MKKFLAILINSLIVILEVIALTYSIRINGDFLFIYYTELSNLLLLISTSIYLLNLIFGKGSKKWINDFNFISICSITNTFLTVLLVLAPIDHFRYGFYLFHNDFIFFHTLCPVLAIVKYLFFDYKNKYNKKTVLIGLGFTCIYSALTITLNIIRKIVGPYPFLMVYNQPVFVSIFWFISMFLVAYGICYGLNFFQNKIKA